MKLMIASDIHGSAYYCLEMLDAMKKECPDRLLLLGDILYHGPRNDLPLEYEPKKVIKMLNEVKEKLFCVRGNCDTDGTGFSDHGRLCSDPVRQQDYLRHPRTSS